MKEQIKNQPRVESPMMDKRVEGPQAEEQIRVDGFKQVLSLLMVADDAFRESLLRRLNERDPTLVKMLRRELQKARY